MGAVAGHGIIIVKTSATSGSPGEGEGQRTNDVRIGAGTARRTPAHRSDIDVKISAGRTGNRYRTSD